MTIVPFPNNFDTYFQNAMNEIAAGNFESASVFIDKALAIQMDDDLFNIAVSLLQNQNQPEEALQLINTHKGYLYSSVTVEEADLLLITLLIDTGNFSEAEKQIDLRWATLKNKAEYAYLENVLEQYLNRIADEKKRETEAIIDNIFNESQDINKKSYFLQVDFVKSLSILSNADFEFIARPLLIDEAIHPLIKTEIMTILSDRSFDTAFQVSKHGVTESVVPLSLPQPDYTLFYLEGMSLVESMEGDNIIEMQSYFEVLFLHTLYFYPLENSVFKDSRRWFQAIKHPGEDSEYDFYIQAVEKGLDLLT